MRYMMIMASLFVTAHTSAQEFDFQTRLGACSDRYIACPAVDQDVDFIFASYNGVKYEYFDESGEVRNCCRLGLAIKKQLCDVGIESKGKQAFCTKAEQD